ncbi:MAG: hypothetical protein ABFD00_02030 [Chloroherpetonaceae bacterium]
MKRLAFILLFVFTLLSCNSAGPDDNNVRPLPAIKIENIVISGNKIIATILVWTPTPCWYYYKTEKVQDESVYTAQIFGKDRGGVCVQVPSSFLREETIYFSTKGQKTLRFWSFDSTYIDTTFTM